MSEAASVGRSSTRIDYSLIGITSASAVEQGLAEADWYQCDVPREKMRSLLQRRDGPAIRDTILWFVLLFAFAYATWKLWGSWWALVPYAIFATLYASVSDSRWHEAGHGTAFKTDWMNSTLYEIASFMIVRESTPWRWSHTRHHSDTIIVGRDPEIAVPRPADPLAFVKTFFALPAYQKYFKHIVLHAFGHMTAEEKTYIPAEQFDTVFLKARIYLAIYLSVIGICIWSRSLLPILFVGGANLFGSVLTVTYGMTQHAGLAENVLDHRLNCRTVYMNRIHRYLYWNMNYHIEHHMFPLVPYHALPELHTLIKDDCPKPYTSIFNAWREILPAVIRQIHDPAYHVKRELPPKRKVAAAAVFTSGDADAEGWIGVCPAASLPAEEVIRFDHGRKTFALVRDRQNNLFAIDGICTHGNSHLAEGFVKDGIIECSKHNGRFNLVDGSPARAPVCRGISTYPVRESEGLVWVNLMHPGGTAARHQKQIQLRVVSNRSVATFIKELVLTPLDSQEGIDFAPGDYLQIDIPAYDALRFSDFDIPEPYASVWRQQHIFDLIARNTVGGTRNNYSIASNPQTERHQLRFNVRVATPPPGQQCSPGVGSSYIFSLKKGDVVTAIGPFGDFHIKPTQREMIYIGGGAGMAPLRAHLSTLLESESTQRRVSFWYGARSRQELFYDDYFLELAASHPNFTFQRALSSALEEDSWNGHQGFIHEVLHGQYLSTHKNPAAAEYYLCGPPNMIKACTRMLAELGVPESHIAFDEF